MITVVLCVVIAIVSIAAFNNSGLFNKLQFNAYQVYHRKEYYRLLSHAFVHGGWLHLFINVFVFFIFGRNVESLLNSLANEGIIQLPLVWYIVFFLLSALFSTSISIFKYKDDVYYNAVGASGAVSAVLFFWIFFNPWEKLYLYGVLPIPAIIFAVAYIIYSQYMSKRNQDNIGHDAHLLGAVFGFVFPLFINLKFINIFLSQILNF
ncbi:MAG: rhomboid family intramembrane serine protease [Bacteroidetes bacterium]|jgi:membrane associated rhomboid family serine protease|nr:rhomboid family intramembrane serine protease [Bacteroidota bacterium]